MSAGNTGIRQRNQGGRGRRLLNRFASVIFILAVVTVSVFFFLRRDILVYDDQYGYLGVLILCFLCNATVFAPAPSLFVAFTAAQSLDPAAVTLLGALGTTLGEMVGYLSGSASRNLVAKTRNVENKSMAEGENRRNRTEEDEKEEDENKNPVILWISRHGAFGVFLFALLPLPFFDLAGVASGYNRMPWPRFLAACFAGKLIKMAVYVLFSVRLKGIFALWLP